MWKKKLCLGLSETFSLPFDEQIKALAQIGFDAFFIDLGEREQRTLSIPSTVKFAKELGLECQSVHAPFGGAGDMWDDDEEEAQKAIKDLTDCIHECQKAEIPIMIAHAYLGFEPHTPNQKGIDRYGETVKEAEKCGVKIAFENTENEAHLFALLDAFKGNSAVGFCWDSGHEMCYNHSQDLLAMYGDMLIATHINDNLGISSFDGVTTWKDDLHLLPFDGIADWNKNADRLKKCGYDGILTFELTTKSKPNRRENDKYAAMNPYDYLTEAYKRACRFGAKILLNTAT